MDWHARRAEAAERLAAAERCFRRRCQDGQAVRRSRAAHAAGAADALWAGACALLLALL